MRQMPPVEQDGDGQPAAAGVVVTNLRHTPARRGDGKSPYPSHLEDAVDSGHRIALVHGAVLPARNTAGRVCGRRSRRPQVPATASAATVRMSAFTVLPPGPAPVNLPHISAGSRGPLVLNRCIGAEAISLAVAPLTRGPCSRGRAARVCIRLTAYARSLRRRCEPLAPSGRIRRQAGEGGLGVAEPAKNVHRNRPLGHRGGCIQVVEPADLRVALLDAVPEPFSTVRKTNVASPDNRRRVLAGHRD